MEIYVQSRGDSEEYEYRWLKITEQEQRLEIPSILTRSILTGTSTQVRISDLIQSEAPSVVLARDKGELLLLVTGLESNRQDFRGRKIRNSVAWVCQDSDDNERDIRAIAVQALRGSLSPEIDKTINFGENHGFQVSLDALNQLAALQKVENFDAILRWMIGKNSEELRKNLADQLQESRLPVDNGVLVVVTGIKTEAALKEAEVWRGLSNSVEAEGWKPPYKKSPDEDEVVDSTGQAIQKTNSLIFLFMFLGLIIILGIILFLVLSPRG